MTLATLTPAEQETLAAWAPRLGASLINPRTLLATDYLNHFNEMIMLIGMAGDMPEILEDLKQWKLKSYAEHFQQSGLNYGDLAAEAYNDVPAVYKTAFEQTVKQIVQVIDLTRKRLEADLAIGDMDELRRTSASAAALLTNLIGAASGIIAGDQETVPQSEIDKLFGA